MNPFEVKMHAQELANAAMILAWAEDAQHAPYMQERAHDHFAKLAKLMGYRIEKIEEVEA